MDIIQEAIKVSLKSVDEGFDVLLQSGTGMATKMVVGETNLRRELNLKDGEKPVYEFSSDKNYSLITSHRLISIRLGDYKEIDLQDVEKIRPIVKNDENLKAWTTIRISGNNQDSFLMEFDFGSPTYFAFILIENLSSQLKFGKWSFNPSGKD